MIRRPLSFALVPFVLGAQLGAASAQTPRQPQPAPPADKGAAAKGDIKPADKAAAPKPDAAKGDAAR